jgi:hypothetical protein
MRHPVNGSFASGVSSRMQLSALCCSHCGAPLEIAASARFHVCAYCRNTLQVHRTAKGAYTEVLARVEENTACLVEEMRLMRSKAEVEVLEQDWRDHLRVAEHMPKGEAFGTCLGITVLCGLLVAAAFDQPAGMQPGHWWMAGICAAFALLGAAAFVQCVRQRRSFNRQCAAAQDAERIYLSRKAALKAELGLP